jgi:addiction module HigA family antidote
MALPAIHPGEQLAEELEALDMSAAELARKIEVPTNRVTQILNGTRAITGDTALRLAHFFGTSAQFWLNLQSLYDLRRAQEKAGKSIQTLPTLKRSEPVHAGRLNTNEPENQGRRMKERHVPRRG